MPRQPAEVDTPTEAPAENRDWRALQNEKARRKVRPQTARARKRRTLKAWRLAAFTAAFVLLGVAGLSTIWLTRTNWELVSKPSPKVRLTQIHVVTDGVLTEQWVIDKLALPEEVQPLELDLFKLKALLEEQPQIAEAQLRLDLPSALYVEVKEREPILRVRAQWPDGRVGLALIARDGTVYEGYNYSRERLKRLPGAVGMPLAADGPGKFRPIDGMEVVAEFLERAASRTPDLWQDWKTISLTRFDGDVNAPDALIKIQGTYVREWVFAPGRDLDAQLAAANQLYVRARTSRIPTLAVIDVSFVENAVVRLP